MKKLIIASAFTILFTTGYSQTVKDLQRFNQMLAKQDSIRNIESKKSWDRFQKVFDAETKRIESTPLKDFPNLRRILILLEIHINHPILFKITEIHPILLNPRRKW